MPPIVPLYTVASAGQLVTQVGSCLSTIAIVSFAENAGETGVLVRFDSASVNAPEAEPVFLMSTVPVAVPPGFMPEAVRIAAPDLLLVWLMVPALNTFEGFALVELKFAPDPTAMPVAARTPTRPAITLRGEAVQRAFMRDIRDSLLRGSPIPAGGFSHDPSGLFTARSCDRP